MRFIRLMAIGVVLLVLVGSILGMACAGARGEQGPKGDAGADGVGIKNIVNNGDGTFTVRLSNGMEYTADNMTGPQGEEGEKGDKGDTGSQGVQGVQGEPGPNMIVAMGFIIGDGTIGRGYNVTSCSWNAAQQRYDITLTDINYISGRYVTLVTPTMAYMYGAGYETDSGKLCVVLIGNAGNPGMSSFSFMVLRAPSWNP